MSCTDRSTRLSLVHSQHSFTNNKRSQHRLADNIQHCLGKYSCMRGIKFAIYIRQLQPSINERWTRTRDQQPGIWIIRLRPSCLRSDLTHPRRIMNTKRKLCSFIVLSLKFFFKPTLLGSTCCPRLRVAQDDFRSCLVLLSQI